MAGRLWLHGLWNVRRVLRLEVGNRQAHFFNETTICLRSNDFQLDQNTFRSFEERDLLSRIDEHARQDLVYNRNAVDLIPQDVRQDMVTGRVE